MVAIIVGDDERVVPPFPPLTIYLRQSPHLPHSLPSKFARSIQIGQFVTVRIGNEHLALPDVLVVAGQGQTSATRRAYSASAMP
jgi:hypothetical protein